MQRAKSCQCGGSSFKDEPGNGDAKSGSAALAYSCCTLDSQQSGTVCVMHVAQASTRQPWHTYKCALRLRLGMGPAAIAITLTPLEPRHSDLKTKSAVLLTIYS